ncbi:MAG: Maf family protein [Clostridiales bacterium]|nr:Maf family protein [Clostridiales bacterium]
MKRVILASGSPRRRELLAQTGINFEVIPGEVDEDAVVQALRSTESGTENHGVETGAGNKDEAYPAQVVKALSSSKAEAVAAQIPEGIVIGSDTIVWDNEILGKPKDRADAYRMLRRLQGREHSVYTGVTVLVKNAQNPEDVKNTKKHVFFCETKVEVYPMTEKETEEYLDTGEAMDKAGAYGIQGKFGLWIKRIDGDYNSVVGLPLSALWQVLKAYV